MRPIIKKELWNFFGNWSAWLVAAAFSVISGLFLFFFENDSNIFDIGTASLQSYFLLAPWLLLFIIPAVSMKTLAEEQQSGTLLWLFSQPLKTTEIVGGKFIAVWVVGLVCLLPSLVYLYTVSVLGLPANNLDWGALLGSYFGLVILCAAFSAVGILASALSANQILAYLLGVFLSFLMFFGIEQLANFRLLGGADYWLSNLGFYRHYIAFSRGLVDTRDVFYFLAVIMVCLFFADVFVQKKK